MADQAFQLVVRKGPRPGHIFPLSDDAISIGRDPVSDIVIDDPEISRHHARLTLGPVGYYLQDMASTNGSFVDGVRLGGEPFALNPGQVIMFGSNVTIVYQAIPESDPMATVVAPASIPYEEEIVPDEPVEPPAPEPLEVEEEVVIAEVVVPEAHEVEEEDIGVEIVAPESLEVEEEGIDVDIVVPESLGDEEEEIVSEMVVPEPEVLLEEPEEDEDLATMIEEPVIDEEPLPEPEPEAELEISEGFPTFDDVDADPDATVDEEPLPVPFVFEEPEPEPEMIDEPELAVPIIAASEPPDAYDLEATMPDVDFQPVIESPVDTMEPGEDAKGGGVNRNVLIAVILLVVMCCCIMGTILILIAIDTWVREDLFKGLELGAVGFFQGMKSLGL